MRPPFRALSAVTLVTVAVLCYPRVLGAQEPSRASLLGQKVRITPVDGGPVVSGTVRVSDDQTLGLVRGPDDDLEYVPFGRIEQLEISLGVRGHTREGFLAGASLGMLAFGAEGMALAKEVGESRLEGLLIGAAFGGAAGGLVGGFLGAVVRSERWRRIPLGPPPDGGIGLSVAPTFGRGTLVGLSVSTR